MHIQSKKSSELYQLSCDLTPIADGLNPLEVDKVFAPRDEMGSTLARVSWLVNELDVAVTGMMVSVQGSKQLDEAVCRSALSNDLFVSLLGSMLDEYITQIMEWEDDAELLELANQEAEVESPWNNHMRCKMCGDVADALSIDTQGLCPTCQIDYLDMIERQYDGRSQ